MTRLEYPAKVAPWRWAIIVFLLLAAVTAGFASGKHAQDEAEKARLGWIPPAPPVSGSV